MPSAESDKAQYESLLELAGRHLSPAQVSLLRFSLGLHIYSPKIAMFQQIAQGRPLPAGCDTVADVAGRLTCRPQDVESLAQELDSSQ